MSGFGWSAPLLPPGTVLCRACPRTPCGPASDAARVGPAA